eukprot:3941413-Rhodomonas_salina.1
MSHRVRNRSCDPLASVHAHVTSDRISIRSCHTDRVGIRLARHKQSPDKAGTSQTESGHVWLAPETCAQPRNHSWSARNFREAPEKFWGSSNI